MFNTKELQELHQRAQDALGKRFSITLESNGTWHLGRSEVWEFNYRGSFDQVLERLRQLTRPQTVVIQVPYNWAFARAMDHPVMQQGTSQEATAVTEACRAAIAKYQ